MKNKLFLLIAITIAATVLNAQDYEIISVEPTNLTAGMVNSLEIVLNKPLAEGDSLWMMAIWAYDEELEHERVYDLHPYRTDSIISTSLYIPNDRQHDSCVLYCILLDSDFTYSDSISFDSITIGGGIGGEKPEICMVSVDSSNRNMIIWEPDYEEFINSVLIYKETAINDEFEMIGATSVGETSIFIDTESENTPNSNRYKIVYMDTAGLLSSLSPPHKTLHLLISMGINGSINLIWEKYEGFEYTTFHIYRGSSKQEMMKIAELASNIFTYSDLAPPLGNLYYQVVIENPAPCDITKQKSAQDIFSSTKSNFVEYSVVSNELTESDKYAVFMYPNPVSDYLTINIDNFPVEVFDVEIHDLSGRSIQNYTSIQNGSKIDLSNLNTGMYLVTIRSNGINQNKLISKE